MKENLDLIGARITPQTNLDPCRECDKNPRSCGEQLHNMHGGVECRELQKPISVINIQLVIATRTPSMISV